MVHQRSSTNPLPAFSSLYPPADFCTHYKSHNTGTQKLENELQLASMCIPSPPWWPAMTLTFDLQNLIRSSVRASKYWLSFIENCSSQRYTTEQQGLSGQTNERTDSPKQIALLGSDSIINDGECHLTKAHHPFCHSFDDIKLVSIKLNILISLSSFRCIRLRSIFHVCISTRKEISVRCIVYSWMVYQTSQTRQFINMGVPKLCP